MKKALSLLLALLCAASLLCAPAFAAESSTEGGDSSNGGSLAGYSIAPCEYKLELDSSRGKIKDLGNGWLHVTYDRLDDFSYNGNQSFYLWGYYNIPVKAYYKSSAARIYARAYYYDNKTGEKKWRNTFCSVQGANGGGASSDFATGPDWVSLDNVIIDRGQLASGKQAVLFNYTIGGYNGTFFEAYMYLPPLIFTDNDYNNEVVTAVRNPQDYFSAGKKAFFACPNCGTLMNQSYDSYVGVIYSNQSLECPSCGKVITNKSWLGGLVYKHSESGGDHQGLLGPDAPVQVPSGSTNVPYPDGTSKPLEYKNAYTENNVTYIYADDRVIEYYPASLTGNGDVYVTYEYGGDTYITVQGYTPPACSHVYDDGVIDPAPTCTTPGKLMQTCTLCGDKKVSAVPTVSHSYDAGTREEPTCIASGTLTQTCIVCNDKKVVNLPSLGHDWQAVKTVNTQYGEDGTLLQQGYVLYECTRCHEQYKAESTGGQVTPPPSGGGDSGGGGGGSGGGDSGDDGGGESIWDKIWGGIGDILGFIVNGLGQVLGGIIEALVAVAKQLVEGITTLLDSILNVFTSVLTWGGNFGEFVGTFFGAFPPEIVTLFVLSISLAIVLMIIKFFRK